MILGGWSSPHTRPVTPRPRSKSLPILDHRHHHYLHHHQPPSLQPPAATAPTSPSAAAASSRPAFPPVLLLGMTKEQLGFFVGADTFRDSRDARRVSGTQQRRHPGDLIFPVVAPSAAAIGGGGGAEGTSPAPSPSNCAPVTYKPKIRRTPVNSAVSNPNADAAIPGSAASLGFEMLEYDALTEDKRKKWKLFGKRKRKSRESSEVSDTTAISSFSIQAHALGSSLEAVVGNSTTPTGSFALWFNELEGDRPRTQPSSRCVTPLGSPRRGSNASASSYSLHSPSERFRESRAGSIDSSASGLAVLAMAEAVPPSASSAYPLPPLAPQNQRNPVNGAPPVFSPNHLGLGPAEVWSPPESWWVRTPTDEEEHESGRSSDDIEDVTWDASSDRNMYVLRIFRPDDTFSTVSCQVNTKTSELCAMLVKKFFLRDVSLCQLSVRKNGLDRVLGPNEKPVQLMRRWLEQLGYRKRDGLEDLGREDHSYYFRFTFGEATVPNLPLLEASVISHGRFRHVDFQARNLQTIPIILFRNANQIDSLDVSENLSIDIPLDFIQLCTSLRELRVSGCNFERVPSSILHATNLRHLDLSHNKLKDLRHAEIEKLSVLQSLLVDHNELESLPNGWRLFNNLTSLSASNNTFISFPEVLCQISTLQELNLSFNKIASIPASIGSLLELRRLLLIANHIDGPLPLELAALQHLEELDIRTNAISDVGVVENIPSLELLFADRNSITVFMPRSLASVTQLSLSKNVFTNFAPVGMAPLITYLNLSGSKLVDLCEIMPCQLPMLEELILDDNHLTSLPDPISSLANLRTLSVTNNHLTLLPKNIHKAQSLEILDVHNNNLKALPAEVWWCKSLVTLNVSSNLLESLPLPPVGEPDEDDPAVQTDNVVTDPTTRRAEVADRPSIPIVARAVDASHKPSSSFSSSLSTSSPIAAIRRPLSLSLQNFYLGDNSLSDDIFVPLTQLPELRVLNLCFNDIYEIPSGALFNQTALVELHLSGNHLSSLPGEEIERLRSLKALYVAGNKLQTLPAELSKLHKLTVLDIGNNFLKYNVANWPYDWNWNWNPDLRYLNFSGNKRLEIKQPQNEHLSALFSPSDLVPGTNGVRGSAPLRNSAPHTGKHSKTGKAVTLKQYRPGERNLADFSAMANLRVLGLIDVTIMETVPDDTVIRRVRTASSDINGVIGYGMSGKLGENEVIRSWDRVSSNLLGRSDEALISLFACCSSFDLCGCRTTRFLNDWIGFHFTSELKRVEEQNLPADDPERPFRDALRRSYLSVNKELGFTGMHDVKSGASGAVIYLKDKKMFVSNVGDVEVVMSKSGGAAQLLSRKHVPWDAKEMERIREAGGWVSEEGLVNGESRVSRAFGYFHLLPAVRPEPHIQCVKLSDQDEFVIIANRCLWERISYQTAVDIARTEREDPMAAAQKLTDFAVAYGAKDGITVMVFTVGDLFHGRRGPRSRRSGKGGACQGEGAMAAKNRRGKQGAPGDSTLARLEKEVEPPRGKVALVFTDIKSSTFLWENYPIAMRSAIKIHNSVMRRLLRSVGGYEVKTEGDAFMVCFPTVTLAVFWCFSVQLQLLEADWPQEILASDIGCDVFGESLTPELLFRGLSVRMGIHWGFPVCEVDPVTRRMDYFGPMVNRAARICNVADGGQICVSSDVVAELTSHKELFTDPTAEEEDLKLPRDIHALRKMGIKVVGLGERKLKGLENAEVLSLLYPKSLSGRIQYSQAARCATSVTCDRDLSTSQVQEVSVSPGDNLTSASQVAIEAQPSQIKDLATANSTGSPNVAHIDFGQDVTARQVAALRVSPSWVASPRVVAESGDGLTLTELLPPPVNLVDGLGKPTGLDDMSREELVNHIRDLTRALAWSESCLKARDQEVERLWTDLESLRNKNDTSNKPPLPTQLYQTL